MDNQATVVRAPHLCEPFLNGRDTGRLIHDFGMMLSLLNPEMMTYPILDFGAGSCWITEFIARMGQSVTAFDIHTDLPGCIAGRVAADQRIDSALIVHAAGDGHAMPLGDGIFGHTLCYDTLHHMQDYDRVFGEFARVLRSGGRAIFVEPGADHSTSPQTIAFLKLKSDDPTWIERDVVLEEVNECAVKAGFNDMTVAPCQHPLAPVVFKIRDWLLFRNGEAKTRRRFSDSLALTNYNQRVIFYFDKP